MKTVNNHLKKFAPPGSVEVRQSVAELGQRHSAGNRIPRKRRLTIGFWISIGRDGMTDLANLRDTVFLHDLVQLGDLTTRQNVLRKTEAFRAQPATRWKSVTAPVKPVHKRIQPFESMIPVVIVDRVIDIPDRAYRTGVAAGATRLDRIYLIHNGVAAGQADVTFFRDSRLGAAPFTVKARLNPATVTTSNDRPSAAESLRR